MTRRYSNAVRTERARHFAAVEAVAEDRRRRRDAAMGLIAAGELTASEGARMTGLHLSTVRRQAKAMGFDPRQARRDYLAQLAAHAADYAALFDIVYGDRL